MPDVISIFDTDNREVSLEEILRKYPSAYAVDAGGFELDLRAEDPWEYADIRGDCVALIWESEDDSHDDPGHRAVAEVFLLEEEGECSPFSPSSPSRWARPARDWSE